MIGGQGNLDAWGIGIGVFFEEVYQGLGFERVKIGIVRLLDSGFTTERHKVLHKVTLRIRLLDCWIIGFFNRKVREGLRKGLQSFWHANPDGSGAIFNTKEHKGWIMRLFD